MPLLDSSLQNVMTSALTGMLADIGTVKRGTMDTLTGKVQQPPFGLVVAQNIPFDVVRDTSITDPHRLGAISTQNMAFEANRLLTFPPQYDIRIGDRVYKTPYVYVVQQYNAPVGSGSFRLGLQNAITASIDCLATAAEVQAALAAAAGGTGVSVTAPKPGGPYTVVLTSARSDTALSISSTNYFQPTSKLTLIYSSDVYEIADMANDESQPVMKFAKARRDRNATY